MTTIKGWARSPDLIEEVMVQLIRSLGLHRPLTLPGGAEVSLSEVSALWALAGADAGPLTQGELGRRLSLEKSTVSRLIAGLERRGWVVRRRDTANRRFVRVELTDGGRELTAELARFMHDRHQRVLRGLTAAERDALRVGIGALSREVEAASRAGH